MSCKYDHDAKEYLNDGEPCRRDDYGDPTKHCTAARSCSHHVARDELTCARCLGRVRANLRRIPPLAAFAVPVALTAGVNSEAANLAGPAADAEAWTWRKVAARQGGSWHLSLIEDDDELHPYSVLTRWAMMIAEDYGHNLPTLTVSNAAEYLDRHLGRIAQDETQDFALLGHEIRRCRRHMESAMSTAMVKERGAPCPDCAGKVKPRLVREYGHWCEDPDCERIHYATDEADRWVCPRNSDHWRSLGDYDKYLEERQGA